MPTDVHRGGQQTEAAEAVAAAAGKQALKHPDKLVPDADYEDREERSSRPTTPTAAACGARAARGTSAAAPR